MITVYRLKDITSQCTVELQCARSDEALIYLYAPIKDGHVATIGIFDKSGFHYMDGVEEEGVYCVEDSYLATRGVTWFKVTEKIASIRCPNCNAEIPIIKS